MLQKWYAATGDEGARDPYFLYAASNLGSFVALIAYPLVVERTLPLRQQARLWTVGYAVLVGMTLVCAVAAWRTRAHVRRRRAARRVARRRRGDCVGPPGALGGPGVRALEPADGGHELHVDRRRVGAAALDGAARRSISLTFIVAFSPSASRRARWPARLMPLAIIVLTLVLVAQMNQPLSLVIPLHLAVFAIVALVCHGELAHDRPSPARLTEFYFWIALGGMLGGLFNALRRAGACSPGIAEYPLVLVAGVPGPARASRRRGRGIVAARRALAIAVGGAAVASVLVNNQFGSASRFLILGAARAGADRLQPAAPADAFRRMRRAAAAVRRARARARSAAPCMPTRTFFGVYRVRVDERLHYRFMFHGSTLHGMQSRCRSGAHESLSYFHRTGPIGQVFANVPNASRDARGRGRRPRRRVAGELRGPGAAMDLLRDRSGRRTDRARSRVFHLPAATAARGATVTIGDARLSLGPRAPAAVRRDHSRRVQLGRDSDPPADARGDGALPVTPRPWRRHRAAHLEPAPVAQPGARAGWRRTEGLTALWQREPATRGSLAGGKFPSEWMVLAREPRDLGGLTSDPRWNAPGVRAIDAAVDGRLLEHPQRAAVAELKIVTAALP